MITRALATQIPSFWEVIKFASEKATRLSGDELRAYLEQLLVDLLSNQAQCFIRASEDKQVLVVVITKIIADIITGEKSLLIETLYSFVKSSIEDWKVEYETLKKFAKAMECKRITAVSRVPRVFEIVEQLGMTERYRTFVMEVN